MCHIYIIMWIQLLMFLPLYLNIFNYFLPRSVVSCLFKILLFSGFFFTFNSIKSGSLLSLNISKNVFGVWNGHNKPVRKYWCTIGLQLQYQLTFSFSWLHWKWMDTQPQLFFVFLSPLPPSTTSSSSSSSSSSAHLVFHVSVGHVWARAGVLLSSGLGRERERQEGWSGWWWWGEKREERRGDWGRTWESKRGVGGKETIN